jgi:hypothetical protein
MPHLHARVASIIAAVCLTLALAQGATLADAAQGHQGLQGGWAVNDSGQIQFTHSLSSEYPYVQQAGAGWVRINFRLGACFSDWTTPTTTCQSTAYAPTATAIYDTIVGAALSDHLTVLGLLSNESWPGSQTDWTANNTENTGGNGSNTYISSFATSAAGYLAAHFAGKITQWEVWNEPNAWTSTGSPGVYSGGSFIYPSNFAQMLSQSYPAIKSASAANVVVSGGLFGTDPSGTPATLIVNGKRQDVIKHASSNSPFAAPGNASSVACTSTVPSGASYLCNAYQMGIAEAGWKAGAYPLDAIGQHLYINYNTTTTSSNISMYLQDVRNAYVGYEGQSTAKQTQVTEVGWSTASVSAHVQAQNLQTAFQSFKSTTYVSRGYWFDVQDIPEANLYYGLVTSTGGHKSSLTAYQKYATY